MSIKYYNPEDDNSNETFLNRDPFDNLLEEKHTPLPHYITCASFCPCDMAKQDIDQITHRIDRGNIFISGYHTARCPRIIQKHKIGAVISIGIDVHHNIPTFSVDFDDTLNTDITPYLEPSRMFLYHHLQEKNVNVLIHCYAGISRSISICLYYLAITNDWSYDRALEFIKTNRKDAKPNYGFEKTIRTILEQRKRIHDTVRNFTAFPL